MLSHVLIVRPDPADPHPDFYEYEVDCPGVTDQCRRWEECAVADCPISAEWDDGDSEAHGQPHKLIAGMWMTPTEHCYVAVHDGLPDAVAGDFAPGRHDIDWEVGDGTELSVFAAGQIGAKRA